jgi:thiol:disulfide interchange protein DsbD
MKKAYVLILAVICAFTLVPVPCRADTVQWEVLQCRDLYEPGKTYPIAFRLAISKSWYIHGTEVPEGELLFPTQLSFEAPEGLELRSLTFPTPEKIQFDYSDHPVDLFSGNILVKAELVVSDTVAEGYYVVKGHLAYQACSAELCLPPEEVSLSIPVSVVAPGSPTSRLNQHIFPAETAQMPLPESGAPAESGAGLLLTFLGFFLGGLALNLTPCIYPLIPITVSYFGAKSGRFRGQTLFHAGLYMLGLAFTNSMLGLWAALSGRIVGSALQHPLVLVFMAGLFVLLGLSSFGFWEFRVPASMTRAVSKSYGGYFGTLFMGLTLGIVAAPCLGPFILGLLTYVGQKGDPLFGFLCFFILSLGLGLPLAVLAFFSGAVDRLPVSGDWMLWIRKLMGWVLLGMAAYMVSLLVHWPHTRALLFSGVIVAAALHLGWLDRTGAKIRTFLYVKKALSIVLILGACFYFWSAYQEREGIIWVPYSEKSINIANGNNTPVIVDFGAEWCGPCLIMDREVFTDPEIMKLSRNFETLRVDLTRIHPDQKKLLEKYEIKGVPTVIFLNREGVELKHLRIECIVSKTDFLNRMRAVLEPKKGGKGLRGDPMARESKP